MAEHFRGREHTVHTSNGGTEQLLRVWIGLGEAQDGDPDTAAVLAFLRERLGRGDGGRSFDLDPPPAELAPAPRLRAFARINAALAGRLASGRLDGPVAELDWAADRDARLRRLADLLELQDMVAEALPPGSPPLAPVDLGLAPEDEPALRLERLLARQRELRRRGAAPRRVLAVLDEAIATAARVPGEDPRWDLLHERADLLLELGETEAAAAALRAAAAATRDPDLRQATDDLATELESGD